MQLGSARRLTQGAGRDGLHVGRGHHRCRRHGARRDSERAGLLGPESVPRVCLSGHRCRHAFCRTTRRVALPGPVVVRRVRPGDGQRGGCRQGLGCRSAGADRHCHGRRHGRRRRNPPRHARARTIRGMAIRYAGRCRFFANRPRANVGGAIPRTSPRAIN